MNLRTIYVSSDNQFHDLDFLNNHFSNTIYIITIFLKLPSDTLTICTISDQSSLHNKLNSSNLSFIIMYIFSQSRPDLLEN